jgi:hypothetical protein
MLKTDRVIAVCSGWAFLRGRFLLLSCDESAHITGHNIVVDGGYTL